MVALAQQVDANQGMESFTMRQIREACSFQRLTPGVNQQISDRLAQNGLGHLPLYADVLPLSQEAEVWLYSKASQVGQVIETGILNPTNKGVRRLLSLVNDDANETLDRMRALLA